MGPKRAHGGRYGAHVRLKWAGSRGLILSSSGLKGVEGLKGVLCGLKRTDWISREGLVEVMVGKKHSKRGKEGKF